MWVTSSSGHSSTLASIASVIVCHEGTDTLFSRPVTVDGDTKPSLPAGSLSPTAQKALCDTGGASFGDISGHGTVTADVDLGPGH